MTTDAAFALTRELQTKQVFVDQLRALSADDPDFFIDLIEGETSLLDLLAKLDASIVDDDMVVDGAKNMVERLQARRRSAEHRIELKRRLLAHALHQIGLKTLRLPTSTLTVTESGIKAVATAPEEIPSCWWRPQPPKLDQEGLTKAIRARDKALKSAEAILEPQLRAQALAEVEALYPVIPGVGATEPSLTLLRRV